jgi:carboxypeptidase T
MRRWFAVIAFLAVLSPSFVVPTQANNQHMIYLPEVLQQGNWTQLPAGYHSVNQIEAMLFSLAAKSPQLATVEQIGVSWSHRPIYALRICSVCTGPSIVYIAGQHAREISTPEVVLDFANDLINGWQTDPTLTSLIEHVTLWFVPVANPDGHIEVEVGQANWRKNIDNTMNTPSDATLSPPYGIGVDLNRNFGYHWGQGGASTAPGDQTYQGPSAFSEPEDQAMRDFLTSVRPVVLLDYHSPYATVLWPWGYQSKPSDAASTLTNMGMTLAMMAGYGSGQTYATFGLTTGDTLDWAYGTLGIYAIGVELDGGFAPPAATVASIYAKNKPGMIQAAEWALAPP